MLKPAIDQINDNALGAGFTVTRQVIKQGRAVAAVRFTLTQVNARVQFAQPLREAGQEPASASLLVKAIRLGPTDYESRLGG